MNEELVVYMTSGVAIMYLFEVDETGKATRDETLIDFAEDHSIESISQLLRESADEDYAKQPLPEDPEERTLVLQHRAAIDWDRLASVIKFLAESRQTMPEAYEAYMQQAARNLTRNERKRHADR